MICFVWCSSNESEGLMHRSLETRMPGGIIACVLVLIAAQILMAAEPAVLESTKAREDTAPSTDPTIPFWRGAQPSIPTKLLTARANRATAQRSSRAGQRR